MGKEEGRVTNRRKEGKEGGQRERGGRRRLRDCKQVCRQEKWNDRRK
jgi:hypothetical protein